MTPAFVFDPYRYIISARDAATLDDFEDPE
jgi:hypothetical protein